MIIVSTKPTMVNKKAKIIRINKMPTKPITGNRAKILLINKVKIRPIMVNKKAKIIRINKMKSQPIVVNKTRAMQL